MSGRRAAEAFALAEVGSLRHAVPYCLAAMAALACCNRSDSNESPDMVGSCAMTVTPCGGDVSGTWSFESACGELTEQFPGCPPDAAVSATSSFDTAGTTVIVTFAVGGAFRAEGETTVVDHETIPTECIGGTPPPPCSLMDVTHGQSSRVCVNASPTTCSCTVTLGTPGAAYGSYSTNGSAVTLSISGTPFPSDVPYCVRGDELHLIPGPHGALALQFLGVLLASSQQLVFKRVPDDGGPVDSGSDFAVDLATVDHVVDAVMPPPDTGVNCPSTGVGEGLPCACDGGFCGCATFEQFWQCENGKLHCYRDVFPYRTCFPDMQ